jgi:Tfp pilus assembly protein PilF
MEMREPAEVTRPAEPEAAPAPRPTGPAASLYQQADSALRSGDPGRAEILIERALRIDPDQALYWHTLGRAKYDQSAYAQAVQFFLKAESRMGGNAGLARSNRQFLEAARSKAQ